MCVVAIQVVCLDRLPFMTCINKTASTVLLILNVSLAPFFVTHRNVDTKEGQF